jgi:hypothetical protein
MRMIVNTILFGPITPTRVYQAIDRSVTKKNYLEQ